MYIGKQEKHCYIKIKCVMCIHIKKHHFNFFLIFAGSSFPACLLQWKLHSSKATKLWCAAMQMDFSLPCLEKGKEVTLPRFSPGSLLSRQPPVKTHDHHSFSLYHHNVPRPHWLTISYTLKFMNSSQCRNWFSMLWLPFASEAFSDFYFWWRWEYDAQNFWTVQLHLMLCSQIWWRSKNTSSCSNG